MKLKLDPKTAAALALPKGRTDEIAWDAELEGFGLRLRRRSGGGLLRNWVCQYRANGHTRRITIGGADKLTPTQAREVARKTLARVELGHDPQAEKETKRQQAVLTFKAVVDEYLAAKQSALRPESYRIAKLYLTGSYFRSLHPMAIGAVTRSDVAIAIRAIVRQRSANTAAAARRGLSGFFGWAIADGLLGNGANPVDGSHRPAESAPRERVLSDAELVAIWKACGDDDFGRITRLLILLGSRRQEIGGMCWSEIDLQAGTWALPAQRSKNRRGYTIALSPPALSILKALPHTDRDHCFGARASAGYVSWQDGKRKLDENIGEAAQPWKIHDVRRTVATRMADIGIAPHVIEACLNHYGGHRAGVAGTYNRSTYERETRNALAQWAEYVLALVEGRDSKIVTMTASSQGR